MKEKHYFFPKHFDIKIDYKQIRILSSIRILSINIRIFLYYTYFGNYYVLHAQKWEKSEKKCKLQ